MAPRVVDDIIKQVEKMAKSGKDDPSYVVQKLSELKKLPPSQQFAVTGLIGFASGYTVGKLGRIVVYTSLGTGALIYFANKAGYVRINWGTLKEDYELCKEQVQDSIAKYCPGVFTNAVQFAKNNKAISAGSVVGFLLGLDISHF